MGYRDQTNYQQPHTLFIQGPETLLRPFTEKYPPPPRSKSHKQMSQTTHQQILSSYNRCNRPIQQIPTQSCHLAEMEIEPLSPMNITSTLTQTIHDLKQLKHTIWTAQNLEKLQEQNKRINFFVNRRYDDFKDNTGRMLDSILQRRSEPIRTDKIILPDRIIIEKQEVKEHIRRHFKLWTKANPQDTSQQTEWEEIYQPIAKIDPTIYKSTTEPITMNELQQTLSLTPKNKATGPLPISNEILQHLPASALNILLTIFNNCL